MLKNLRISTKLLLSIPPLVLLAAGLSAYVNNQSQEREMLRQAQADAQTYGDLIREALVTMMVTTEKVDDRYLERLNTIKDIRSLHIFFTVENLHLRETFQDSTRVARLRGRERDLATLRSDAARILATNEGTWQRKGNLFNAIIPFTATAECQKCHRVPVGHVLGAADMSISLDRAVASIEGSWVRSIWTLYAFTAITILISIILYRNLVSRRLQELLEATKRIGSGDLTRPVTFTESRDELGVLATSFERMRSQLKEAQEKVLHSDRLSTIGQMASSIVHDFRTPMSTINLAIESLEMGHAVTPEKTAHWYKMIRDSVGRMIRMAQELLDFSRSESRMNKIEVSMSEFLTLVTHSVRQTLEQSKITFTVDERYVGNAVFDPDRIHRALVNIINNAQDAMPNGGTITFVSGRENGSISFLIADTGSGIPEEIKDKIFDAFVTAGKKRGTGLGLAITKRIVDEHGGTISFTSERGKGTTFRITLPAV
jgi:signal transduction histidine kinase